MGKSYKKTPKTKWTESDKFDKKNSHKKIRRMTDGICRQYETGKVEDEDVFFPDEKDVYDKWNFQSEGHKSYYDFVEKIDKNGRHYKRPADKRDFD